MAISPSITWEVRTTGSDNNGGGFKPGASGTDFSQQNAAQATLSVASVINAVTTIINVAPGDYTVTVNDVGNILNITGGTATAGVYEITVADTVNNRWTLDRSAGTAGQTVIGAMGGALASIGRAGQFSVSQNKVYIKSGTYTLTSATANIAGGTFQNTGNFRYIEGYNATRGDLGTPPLIQTNGVITIFTVFNLTTGNHGLVNINIDCNSRASARGIAITGGYCYKVKVANSTLDAFQMNADSYAVSCEASGFSGTNGFVLASFSNVHSCYAHDGTVVGFNTSRGCVLTHCISESNAGATVDGFSTAAGTAFSVKFINCVAYNNGRDGFRLNNQLDSCMDCIAEGNAGFGFNVPNATASGDSCLIQYCAGFNNTSGDVNINAGALYSQNLNFVTGSASFFTNAAGGDFSLNTSAGGGALAKATGYPGLFPGGLSTGFEDIGAIQSQGTGGGGGSITSVSAVLRRQNTIPYRTGYSG